MELSQMMKKNKNLTTIGFKILMLKCVRCNLNSKNNSQPHTAKEYTA
jgi:hypothetical protein